MSDEPKPPSMSEADFALISFAWVVLEVLAAMDSEAPKAVARLLEFHQAVAESQGYTIAAGILGSIRGLANDPDRARRREGLQQLIAAHTKGSA